MKFRLDDNYEEGLRQRTDAVGDAEKHVSIYMTDYWIECGTAIIENGKDYKWFVESSAALVGKTHRTVYGYMRVGLNVYQRGLHNDNPALTHDHWDKLLLNTKKGEDKLIPLEEIEERLEWVYSEQDKFGGQVPSTRDIADHYRKNGETPEHELCLKAMKRHAEKLLKCKVTRSMKAWAKKVIKDLDLYFENGEKND